MNTNFMSMCTNMRKLHLGGMLMLLSIGVVASMHAGDESVPLLSGHASRKLSPAQAARLKRLEYQRKFKEDFEGAYKIIENTKGGNFIWGSNNHKIRAKEFTATLRHHIKALQDEKSLLKRENALNSVNFRTSQKHLLETKRAASTIMKSNSVLRKEKASLEHGNAILKKKVEELSEMLRTTVQKSRGDFDKIDGSHQELQKQTGEMLEALVKAKENLQKLSSASHEVVKKTVVESLAQLGTAEKSCLPKEGVEKWYERQMIKNHPEDKWFKHQMIKKGLESRQSVKAN